MDQDLLSCLIISMINTCANCTQANVPQIRNLVESIRRNISTFQVIRFKTFGNVHASIFLSFTNRCVPAGAGSVVISTLAFVISTTLPRTSDSLLTSNNISKCLMKHFTILKPEPCQDTKIVRCSNLMG
jgi:hypothetical protein